MLVLFSKVKAKCSPGDTGLTYYPVISGGERHFFCKGSKETQTPLPGVLGDLCHIPSPELVITCKKYALNLDSGRVSLHPAGLGHSQRNSVV